MASCVRIVHGEVMCESMRVCVYTKIAAVEQSVKIVPKDEVLTSSRGTQDVCQEREELV